MSFNFLEPEFDEASDIPGFALRWAGIGPRVGAEKLGASLYELDPGQAVGPFHWHVANEEMLIALDPGIEVREAGGTYALAPGDVVSFARGERGAHEVLNGGDGIARVLFLSEMRYPEIAVYPDSGKVGVRERHPVTEPGGMRPNFRMADAVDYWEGEERTG